MNIKLFKQKGTDGINVVLMLDNGNSFLLSDQYHFVLSWESYRTTGFDEKIDEYEISFNEEFIQLLKDFNKSLKKTIKQFIVGRYTNDGEPRDPFLDNNLKILMARELDKILEN